MGRAGMAWGGGALEAGKLGGGVEREGAGEDELVCVGLPPPLDVGGGEGGARGMALGGGAGGRKDGEEAEGEAAPPPLGIVTVGGGFGFAGGGTGGGRGILSSVRTETDQVVAIAKARGAVSCLI